MSSGTTIQSARPPAPPQLHLSRQRLILLGVIGLALCHLPLLAAYGQQLWSREHYQFFPCALAGFAILAMHRTRRLGAIEPGRCWLGLVLACAAWGMLLAGTLLQSPWLGMVALLLLVVAVAYTLGGARLLGAIAGPWCLLLLILYPPFGLDSWLILHLQTLVSSLASRLLDVFGIVHLMAGNVVQIPGHQLMVEEACSGINSLFSVLALTLFYLAWVRRRWPHALAVFLMAFGWVVAVNVCRVALLTFVTSEWDLDLLEGWRHQAVGFVLFLVCFGLVVSSDRLLLFLTATGQHFLSHFADGQLPQFGGHASRTRWSLPARTWLTSPVALVPFAVLGLLQLGLDWAYPHTAPTADVAEPLPIGTETLPAELAGWQRVGEVQRKTRAEGRMYGLFSHVWTYRRGKVQAQVSLDYAFLGWHDLSLCYSSSGWAVTNQEQVPGQGETPPCTALVLKKPLAEYGYLWFGLLDSQGHWQQDRRPASLTGRLYQRFVDREPVYPSYQVQVFVQSPLLLERRDRQPIRELFAQASRRLGEELVRQGKVAGRKDEE